MRRGYKSRRERRRRIVVGEEGEEEGCGYVDVKELLSQSVTGPETNHLSVTKGSKAKAAS